MEHAEAIASCRALRIGLPLFVLFLFGLPRQCRYRSGLEDWSCKKVDRLAKQYKDAMVRATFERDFWFRAMVARHAETKNDDVTFNWC